MAETIPMVFTSNARWYEVRREQNRSQPIQVSNKSERAATIRILAWNHDAGSRSRRHQLLEASIVPSVPACVKAVFSSIAMRELCSKCEKRNIARDLHVP